VLSVFFCLCVISIVVVAVVVVDGYGYREELESPFQCPVPACGFLLDTTVVGVVAGCYALGGSDVAI